MAGDEVKVGDVVRLKSGGPPMTVARVFQGAGSWYANCVWFDGAVTKGGDFATGVLEPEPSHRTD